MGPLVLVSAGVVLLLNNLQVVPWSVWQALWPYWPVLLVLLGIEGLVTGRVAWGTLVLLTVLLPLLGFGVTAGTFATRWRDETRSDASLRTASFQQARDGANAATVRIEYGAGVLDIGALPDPQPTETLVSGLVYGHRGTDFAPRSTLRDGRRTVTFSTNHGNAFLDLGRLELQVNPTVPTDLEIESGAAEMTLNLERLRIPNLSIETGASKTRVILPAQGVTMAQIEGGAASFEFVIPPNVAAQIVVEDGPNHVQIDQQRFPRNGSEYRSANFASATDRVTLRIDVGASHVVVQ